MSDDDDVTTSRAQRRQLDRRLGEIKASIAARSEELRQRAHHLRAATDIPARMRAHPWAVVAIGFTAGLLASGAFRRREQASQAAIVVSRPPSVFGALITTIALQAARHLAERWLERMMRAPAHGVAQLPPVRPGNGHSLRH